MEVMRFSLENAIVKMPDGQLWKQEKGIPMGDPISPAMSNDYMCMRGDGKTLDGEFEGKYQRAFYSRTIYGRHPFYIC